MLDYNRWRIERGLPAILPKFKKKVRAVSVSDEALGGLRALAAQHGAKHGDDPSVSALIEMIGLYFLKVEPQDDENRLKLAGFRQGGDEEESVDDLPPS